MADVECDVHFLMYTNVKNAVDILGSGIDDGVLILDLALVTSERHIKLAIFKAMMNERQKVMKTKSLKSEIIYQLSASTKITDSVLHYSLQPTSTELAFVYVLQNSDMTYDTFRDMINSKVTVDGDEIGSSAISELSETPQKRSKIIKFFKISAPELECSSLEDAVLSRLATKDFL